MFLSYLRDFEIKGIGGLEYMQNAEEDANIHPRRSGGFGPSFDKEYHKYKPKDEPVEEWDDRVELYEL